MRCVAVVTVADRRARVPGVHDGGLDCLLRGSRGIGFLGDWHNFDGWGCPNDALGFSRRTSALDSLIAKRVGLITQTNRRCRCSERKSAVQARPWRSLRLPPRRALSRISGSDVHADGRTFRSYVSKSCWPSLVTCPTAWTQKLSSSQQNQHVTDMRRDLGIHGDSFGMVNAAGRRIDRVAVRQEDSGNAQAVRTHHDFHGAPFQPIARSSLKVVAETLTLAGRHITHMSPLSAFVIFKLPGMSSEIPPLSSEHPAESSCCPHLGQVVLGGTVIWLPTVNPTISEKRPFQIGGLRSRCRSRSV